MTEPRCGRPQKTTRRKPSPRTLRADQAAAAQPLPEELQRLVCELEARRVELETQNDELRRTQRKLKRLNETLEQRVADSTVLAQWRANQLRKLAAELTQAEQRERRRLAQLLHDDLQQQLVATKFKLAAIQRRFADEALGPELRRLHEMLNESLDASRALTYELSPPVLFDGGLRSALELLARQNEAKHGLKVEVRADAEDGPADESLRVLLYQVVRELLFNVVKHAGTDRARIELSRPRPDQIQVAVCDEGAGFNPAVFEDRPPIASGFGLSSVRERLQMMGGQFQIESTPGRGTRVTIQVPASS